MQQHRNAKHSSGSAPADSDGFDWSATFARYAVYGGGVLALAYVLVFWVLPWMGQSPALETPSVGDHWHARYEIVLCGEEIPQRPYSQGDIHTHGKGKIHIHPKSDASAGRAANLEAFFESFDGELSENRISVPMHGTYKNGDKCDGEPGQLSVYVNGERVEEPVEYIPQDGDVIQIRFEQKS